MGLEQHRTRPGVIGPGVIAFAIALAIAGAITAGRALPGQVRITRAKALELAFPDCKVERRTVPLDTGKKTAVAKLCKQKFATSMVFPYVATRNGKSVGVAWFDIHKVRSKKQLLMVVVDPEQRVRRVEVIAFAEPPRYAAPARWLRQLHGKRLGALRPGRDVPRLTGATLTVRATTRCVDRVLAIHRVVFGAPPKPEPKPEPKRKPKAPAPNSAPPR